MLLRYADYFDVSMDYIYGRTGNPHGASFEVKPKNEESYPEMSKLIEMCFDPGSPILSFTAVPIVTFIILTFKG